MTEDQFKIWIDKTYHTTYNDIYVAGEEALINTAHEAAAKSVQVAFQSMDPVLFFGV